MNHLLLASLVGSSHYATVRDDSLKDEDNAAWVMELPATERVQWVERIRWIRLVDRLAEKDLIPAPAGQEQGPSEFDRFCQGWQQLKTTQGMGEFALEASLDSILQAIAQQWFQGSPTRTDSLSIQSWDGYLKAIQRYHPHAHINTLDDYEAMLDGLAGSFFQILPFLEPHHWDCARHFGILDQFYNNLRDIHEDAQRGICYFPAETLAEFGVSQGAILDGSCIGTESYRRLMEFWMGDYLLKLRWQAHGMLLRSDLHPSWVRLRAWCLHRYGRIELILRQCQFDFRLFSQCYWPAVRADLEHYHRLGRGTRWPERSPGPKTKDFPAAPNPMSSHPPSPSLSVLTPVAPLALSPTVKEVQSRESEIWHAAIAHFLQVSPATLTLSRRVFGYLHRSLERFESKTAIAPLPLPGASLPGEGTPIQKNPKPRSNHPSDAPSPKGTTGGHRAGFSRSGRQGSILIKGRY